MNDPIVGSEGVRKCDSVADAINRLLHTLVLKCARGEGIRNFYEVAVIGYGAEVAPGFSGKLAGRDIVPISDVAASPPRVEERTKQVDNGSGEMIARKVKVPVWFEPKAKGTTPMGQALDLACKLLSDWTAAHQASYPPIVINITDGEATDSGPVPQAERLRALSTFDGSVLLFNCHISSKPSDPIIFPDHDGELPDDFARQLFSVSSVLPESLRQLAASESIELGPETRGFAFNADLSELIRFLDIGTRSSNLR